MMISGVSSRRKQAKPQRLPSESGDSPSLNGDSADASVDCHVCGNCSCAFYEVALFVEHKKRCRTHKAIQKALTPECPEATPIDLSRSNHRANNAILDDKSNILLQSFDALHHQQTKLLELYAQLASERRSTDRGGGGGESGGDESSPRSSCMLSPPSSNDEVIATASTLHHCAAERCPEAFPSRGALLWHVLNRHSVEKLLQCESCDERFSDHDQHRCDIGAAQRSSSAAEFDRGSSPDADRGSVPALCLRTDFRLLSKSPSPVIPSGDDRVSPRFTLPPPLFASLLKESTSTPLDLTLANNQFLQHYVPHHPPPPPAPRVSFETIELPYSQTAPALLGNDDDWEALMEVSQTDELEKIRALVGDKALPTTDPNQCLLCRRVLSCKSALQMHYRTHTGERPFKCKICQRAFTTKGNLKTHMGVHRAKHSFRHGMHGVAHQCPICQKRFFTPQLLQQHIAQHTNQLTSSLSLLMPPTMTSSSMNAAGFGGIPSSFPGFPSLLGFPLPPPHLPTSSSQCSTPSLSISFPSPFSTKPTLSPFTSIAPSVMSSSLATPFSASSSMPNLNNSGKSEQKGKSEVLNGSHQEHGSLSGPLNGSGRTGDELESDDGDEQTMPATNVPSRSCQDPLDAMKKMWAETEPPPPRAPPILSKHQCAVCFKHFSSSSALQIHMRTHTGDKPFKCDVCGRAFTTRGNLKVHMGTHMWQQNPSRRGRRIFEFSSSSTSPGGISPSGGTSSSEKSPFAGLPPPPPFGFPPLPLGGAAMAAAAAAAAATNPDMMRWMWHTVCSVCQKICSCPSELEQHLQQHLHPPPEPPSGISRQQSQGV